MQGRREREKGSETERQIDREKERERERERPLRIHRGNRRRKSRRGGNGETLLKREGAILVGEKRIFRPSIVEPDRGRARSSGPSPPRRRSPSLAPPRRPYIWSSLSAR